jgi:hypothetical protein
MTEQNLQTPPEQAAEQKAAAEKAAEQERAECRKSASAHVDKAEACVKRAERGLSEGYILAGYHADVALALRLKAGDSRAAAIQGIEGRLSEQSSVAIKADRLIACWHAYRLLQGGSVDDKGKLTDGPVGTYAHFDRAWSHLVQRVNKGKADEAWTLLPGLEQQCIDAFREARDNSTNRDGCSERCNALKRQLADVQAKEKAAQEERAKAERLAKEAAEREALAAEQAAKREAERLAAEAKAAAENTPDAIAKREAADKAAREAGEKERERLAAEAAKHIADQHAARAEREAREADKRLVEAEARKAADERRKADRERERTERVESPKPRENKPTLPTCIGTAKAASNAKELAGLLADMIRESGKDTAEVMEFLCSSLDWSPKMGAAVLRGMARTESRTTALAMYNGLRLLFAEPSRNGQQLAAVA